MSEENKDTQRMSLEEYMEDIIARNKKKKDKEKSSNSLPIKFVKD